MTYFIAVLLAAFGLVDRGPHDHTHHAHTAESIDADPTTVHHEPSGLRIDFPPDTRVRLGRYDDGLSGGRRTSVFPVDDPPADWNAASVQRMVENMGTTIHIYAIPDEALPDSDAREALNRYIATLADSPGDVTLDDNALFAGHPAIKADHNAGYGEMGTLTRDVMTVSNGMRYGVRIQVAFLERARGEAVMEDLAQWLEEDVVITIPE